ncbi:MAG TPA: hypothetical protein VFS05_05695 [Gemmatimonadaceae bacterium]|nr:hypothetical protein [Gemmatimonadaceae bacterium]
MSDSPITPEMRHAVLVGSTTTGLVLGLGAGLALLAVGVIVWFVLPPQWTRAAERLRTPLLLLCLGALPIAGAVLGWLEGRLKLR